MTSVEKAKREEEEIRNKYIKILTELTDEKAISYDVFKKIVDILTSHTMLYSTFYRGDQSINLYVILTDLKEFNLLIN